MTILKKEIQNNKEILLLMFQFMMGPSVFNENGIVILEVSVCILCYGCNTIDLKNKKKI